MPWHEPRARRGEAAVAVLAYRVLPWRRARDQALEPIEPLDVGKANVILVEASVDRGRARQVHERLIPEAAAQREVRAMQLGVRLLEQQHPELGAIGLAESGSARRTAREIVIHAHVHPLAVLVEHQIVHAVRIMRRAARRSLGPILEEERSHERRELGDRGDRAHEPAVAESALLHVRGQQPVDEDARRLLDGEEVGGSAPRVHERCRGQGRGDAIDRFDEGRELHVEERADVRLGDEPAHRVGRGEGRALAPGVDLDRPPLTLDRVESHLDRLAVVARAFSDGFGIGLLDPPR